MARRNRKPKKTRKTKYQRQQELRARWQAVYGRLIRSLLLGWLAALPLSMLLAVNRNAMTSALTQTVLACVAGFVVAYRCTPATEFSFSIGKMLPVLILPLAGAIFGLQHSVDWQLHGVGWCGLLATGFLGVALAPSAFMWLLTQPMPELVVRSGAGVRGSGNGGVCSSYDDGNSRHSSYEDGRRDEDRWRRYEAASYEIARREAEAYWREQSSPGRADGPCGP